MKLNVTLPKRQGSAGELRAWQMLPLQRRSAGERRHQSAYLPHGPQHPARRWVHPATIKLGFEFNDILRILPPSPSGALHRDSNEWRRRRRTVGQRSGGPVPVWTLYVCVCCTHTLTPDLGCTQSRIVGAALRQDGKLRRLGGRSGRAALRVLGRRSRRRQLGGRAAAERGRGRCSGRQCAGGLQSGGTMGSADGF